jgi:hypothetical protein
MSEQEFELYLKLLAKCLRLTSGQREQIADELRDHLEERLDELARAGVPREKAVVQALDEFGDAAVLAAHFTTIARLKRRRFLMRLSLGSVGALTAGLLIAFAFWPENRAVRGPERIVAQEKFKPGKSKGDKAEKSVAKKPAIRPVTPASASPDRPASRHPLSSDVVEHSTSESRIEKALDQPVDFTIEPQTLKDAIDYISARFQFPIVIDQKALDDASVDLTTEVRASFPGVKLRNVLKLMLEPLSAPLSFVIDDEVLKITTIEKINEHLVVVVYDCRDLVHLGTLDRYPVEQLQPKSGGAMGGGIFQVAPDQKPSTPGEAGSSNKGHAATSPQGGPGKAAPSEQNHPVVERLPLIQTLIAATGADSWDNDATISEFGGLLVVRQNPFVHERIKSVLANIRLIKQDGAFASMASQYDAEARRRAATLTSAPAWTPDTTDGRQPTGAATPVPARRADPFDPARAQ